MLPGTPKIIALRDAIGGSARVSAVSSGVGCDHKYAMSFLAGSKRRRGTTAVGSFPSAIWLWYRDEPCPGNWRQPALRYNCCFLCRGGAMKASTQEFSWHKSVRIEGGNT